MPRVSKPKTASPSPKATKKQPTKTRAAANADARPVRVKVPVRTFTFSAPTPAEAAAPKKPAKKSAPKKSSTVTRKTTPAYLKMINKAITSIGHRSGSSIIGIANYIEKNFPVKENYKRYLKVAMKKAVDNGDIIKNGSMYRVKPGVSKKKRTTKKKATGETEKKPRAKKASTESGDKSPKKRGRKAAASDDDKPEKVKKAKKIARTEDDSTSASTASTIDTPKKPEGLKGDYMWQYKDGNWRNYFTEASNVVEDTYQKYLANRGDSDVRAVKSGDWEYQVDFAAMKQTNIQHANHTTREIRRVKCA